MASKVTRSFFVMFLLSSVSLYAQTISLVETTCSNIMSGAALERLRNESEVHVQVDAVLKKAEKNLGAILTIKDGRADLSQPRVDGTRFVAFITADYTEKLRILTVSNMFVREDARNKGISAALLAAELAKHPSTEVIFTTALLYDNEDKLRQYLDAGYSVIDAVKETWAYKIRAQFGFTEIMPESIHMTDGKYGFGVRRPR